MKFTVTMKDPDGVYDSVRDAIDDNLPSGLDEDELEHLAQERKEELSELMKKWFRYGEYLSVEIDTEKGTCTVLEE